MNWLFSVQLTPAPVEGKPQGRVLKNVVAATPEEAIAKVRTWSPKCDVNTVSKLQAIDIP